MMLPDVLLNAGALSSIAGVAMLRFAWSQPRRSLALNVAGWGLLIVGAVLGWQAASAWGASVAILWAMAAALVALSWAAATARPGRTKASSRRVGMLPEAGEPLRLAGRALTFVLVAIVSALVSIGIAVAIDVLARAAGISAADAVALALFTTPLAWAIIAYALLMQPARRGQINVLALASLPCWPVLASGVLS